MLVNIYYQHTICKAKVEILIKIIMKLNFLNKNYRIFILNFYHFGLLRYKVDTNEIKLDQYQKRSKKFFLRKTRLLFHF